MRKLRNGDPVIEWAAGKEPANIGTVRFASTKDGGFIRRGNAVVFVKGMIIIFR